MCAFSSQLQISLLSSAILKPNQAKLIMYNLGQGRIQGAIGAIAPLKPTKVTLFTMFYTRGREPMAREPDVALLMTASGSLDIFLTRLLRMKLFP